MKLGKTMKKLSAMIMAFAMIFSLVGFSGNTVTAEAASNPVKLHSTVINFVKYGMTNYYVYIAVDTNSASNKKVYVHHSTYNQGWVDTAASFYKKADANTEIWRAYVSGNEATDFVIKYVGDGVTYWDNNNYKNYDAERDTLGASVNVRALPLRSAYSNYYCVQATVENLAYHKSVKVVYTNDNWATSKTANLSYYFSEEGTNAERWKVDIPVTNKDKFQYYITYTVNGKTYVDNNWGANFDISYYRAY